MKIKHYFAFEKELSQKFCDDMLNEKNWDILRMDERDSAFAIEKDIESYEQNCRNAQSYKNAAQKICDILRQENLINKRIISLGAGKGILEWHLKKNMPELYIECTDYTLNEVEQLKKVFVHLDSAYQFDMLNGDYALLDSTGVLVLYRVSTEFCQEDWFKIFNKIYDAGINYIIFVPTGLDRLRDIIKERLICAVNVLRGRKIIHCGWLYSEKEYLKMFTGGGYKGCQYKIKQKDYFDNTAVYLLERT
jgi:hypothetical protein